MNPQVYYPRWLFKMYIFIENLREFHNSIMRHFQLIEITLTLRKGIKVRMAFAKARLRVANSLPKNSFYFRIVPSTQCCFFMIDTSYSTFINPKRQRYGWMKVRGCKEERYCLRSEAPGDNIVLYLWPSVTLELVMIPIRPQPGEGKRPRPLQPKNLKYPYRIQKLNVSYINPFVLMKQTHFSLCMWIMRFGCSQIKYEPRRVTTSCQHMRNLNCRPRDAKAHNSSNHMQHLTLT